MNYHYSTKFRPDLKQGKNHTFLFKIIKKIQKYIKILVKNNQKSPVFPPRLKNYVYRSNHYLGIWKGN